MCQIPNLLFVQRIEFYSCIDATQNEKDIMLSVCMFTGTFLRPLSSPCLVRFLQSI